MYRALQPFANARDTSFLNRVLSKSGIRRNYRTRYFAIHDTICDAINYIPADKFATLYKFAFVRNPYDWIVSMYCYLQQTESHRYSNLIQQMTFSEYLDFEIKRNKRHQHEFICDASGHLAVDFIGRFERLDDDFTQVMNRLGLDVSLPHINASKRRDYRDYYDDETRAKVATHWHRDISLFDYQFE